MKRILCMILAILAVMTLLPAAAYAADGDPFDPTPDYPTILGEKKGFTYSTESNSWVYQRYYEETVQNSTFVLELDAISVEGGDEVRFTSFTVQILDMNNEASDIPVSVKLVIDGDSYEIQNLYGINAGGFTTLSGNYNLLIEALAYGSADSVSVEIRSEQNTYSFVLNPIRLTATLKEFCRDYVEQRFWHFTVEKEVAKTMEAKCQLFVNGVPANYQEMHKYTANSDRSQELEKTKLEGIELGMTPEQVHAVLGEPLQTVSEENRVMDTFMVEYDRRPKALDPSGDYQSLFQGSNIVVTYEMRDGQYYVISYAYSCVAEGDMTGDMTEIESVNYPLWDLQDYVTALLGPSEETKEGTSYQYVWVIDGQRLRMNVEFAALGNRIGAFVSTGWSLEGA